MDRKTLKQKAMQMNSGVEFMDDRNKGDINNILGKTVTIKEFEFLNSDMGDEYVAFTLEEDPNAFYFGGKVLTEDLKELQNQGYKDEINENGLPAQFGKRKSKNNREYTTVTFFPDDE